jgi:hypothetical protein
MQASKAIVLGPNGTHQYMVQYAAHVFRYQLINYTGGAMSELATSAKTPEELAQKCHYLNIHRKSILNNIDGAAGGRFFMEYARLDRSTQ